MIQITEGENVAGKMRLHHCFLHTLPYIIFKEEPFKIFSPERTVLFYSSTDMFVALLIKGE
jgi:hypothetical protein